MKKFIKWTIPYIFLCIIAVVLIGKYNTEWIMDNSSYIESNVEGDISYQSVNSKDESYIIIWNSKITEDKVIKVGEGKTHFNIIDDTYCNGQIFFQYSYLNEKEKQVYGVGIYYIQSGEFKLNDMDDLCGYQWKAVEEKDKKVYMLLNDTAGKTVKEYRIDIKDEVLCELHQEFSYPEGKFVTDTTYHNGKINMCLNDGSSYCYEGTDIIKYEDIKKSPFGNLPENSVDKNAKVLFKDYISDSQIVFNIIAGLVIVLIIWGIIIGFIVVRSFVVKMMIWTELGFLLLYGIIMASIWSAVEQREVDNISEYSIENLEEVFGFVNESGYVNYDKLISFSEESGDFFNEIIVVNKDKNKMTLSGALKTPVSIGLEDEEYFGTDLKSIINKLDADKDNLTKRIKSGNTEYMVIAIYDRTKVNEERIVLGCVELSDVKDEVLQVINSVRDKFVIAFIIINVIIVLMFLRYALNFKKFSKELSFLVKNHDNYTGVNRPSKALLKECIALDEINRIFSNVKYQKNQNYELYNRFLPKDVETILDKKSLLDIELGDSVNILGSVVTINVDDDSFVNNEIYKHTMESAYEIVNENIKKQNGVFMAHDSRMSDTKVLFKDDINKAIEFAIDTVHGFDGNINIADKQKVFVINYGDYQCGVTGCEEKLIPYAFSKEETMMLNYIESFRKAGIELVLTEDAVEKADNKYSFRYIGYITEAGKNIKMYECLDAYSSFKRDLLINTKMKFKKAISLFYSNDFYLARNTFNEVLKENPNDSIARWYLFNCETILNNPADDNIGYGLFENKVFEQQYHIQ